MTRDRQRLEETIAAIEADVEAKLHRRAEDLPSQFGDDAKKESTVIISKIQRTVTALPQSQKGTTILISVSLVLLAALIVLIVLMLRGS